VTLSSTPAFTRGLRAWTRAAAVLLLSGVLLAQRGFGGFGGRGPMRALPNAPYDGRFTFVRVRYDPAPGGY
jgi:hypothetical protein